MAAVNAARKKNIPVHVGNVLSADIFYNADKEGWKRWADMNVLAVEMEAFSLYCNAAKCKKKALCLLTVSDSFLIKEELTPEQRQNGLLRMIEIGVEAAEKFAK
jgi:purine-nucleoside phosphorylase